MARRIEVEIVGDQSLPRAGVQTSANDRAKNFNAEMAGTKQSLVRVASARGKAIGGLRLTGVGLAAGFALSTTTRAVGELRDSLSVSGEEAETFSGRMRNLGASLLGGDLVGAVQALTRETQKFTEAELQAAAAGGKLEKSTSGFTAIALRAFPALGAMTSKTASLAEVATAAIAAAAGIAETPIALRLGLAQAETTRAVSDDVTQLGFLIASSNERLARLKKIRDVQGASAEIDRQILGVMQERKGYVEQQAKLLKGITDFRAAAATAAKQREAIAERTTARRNRRLSGFLGRIDRQTFRTVEGQPLRAQAAALGAIAKQIRGQIAITNGVERRAVLEDRLIGVLRQQQAVYAAIKDEIKAANQLLQDRANAIKSAVIEKLQQRQTDILNKRALADAKEQLRIARHGAAAGSVSGEARRGLQDVNMDILRARLERQPATLTRGGRFSLAGVVININGVTDPAAVANRVAAILKKRGRHTTTQTRPTAAASA